MSSPRGLLSCYKSKFTFLEVKRLKFNKKQTMTFSVYAKSPVSHEIKLGPSFLSTIPYTKSYNFSNILYFFTTGHLKTERKINHLESLSNNHGWPFMLNFLKKNEE